MNTKLIKGQWEIVSPASPDYQCICSFTTPNENTWSRGVLTTYYLSASGNPILDKVYDWAVSDPNNNETVYLEITLTGQLNGNDPWENTDYFIIEKLTANDMVLKKNEVGDSHTKIKLRRRNDLSLP